MPTKWSLGSGVQIFSAFGRVASVERLCSLYVRHRDLFTFPDSLVIMDKVARRFSVPSSHRSQCVEEGKRSNDGWIGMERMDEVINRFWPNRTSVRASKHTTYKPCSAPSQDRTDRGQRSGTGTGTAFSSRRRTTTAGSSAGHVQLQATHLGA